MNYQQVPMYKITKIDKSLYGNREIDPLYKKKPGGGQRRVPEEGLQVDEHLVVGAGLAAHEARQQRRQRARRAALQLLRALALHAVHQRPHHGVQPRRQRAQVRHGAAQRRLHPATSPRFVYDVSVRECPPVSSLYVKVKTTHATLSAACSRAHAATALCSAARRSSNDAATRFVFSAATSGCVTVVIADTCTFRMLNY